MDGSEPGEVLPAAVLSGAPVDLQARTVRYISIATEEVKQQQLTLFAGYIGQRKQRHNQGTGMVITGAWIGISCKKVIGGKTL